MTLTKSIEASLGKLRQAAPLGVRESVLYAVGSADAFVAVESPIGRLTIAFNLKGISAVKFYEEPRRFARNFAREFGREAWPVKVLPDRLSRELRMAIKSGNSRGLNFDLSEMTPFQQSVLEVTRTIPMGQVRPYGWVAERIGNPRAVRAVGTALGANPVPFLIPCHRVVRSDGTLGNYGLGPPVKRQLLKIEGVDMTQFR